MTIHQLALLLYEIGEASTRGDFDHDEAFRRMGKILDTLTPIEAMAVFDRAIKLASRRKRAVP